MPPIPNLRVPLSVFVCEKELERAWFVGKIGLPFPFSQATLGLSFLGYAKSVTTVPNIFQLPKTYSCFSSPLLYVLMSLHLKKFIYYCFCGVSVGKRG